MAQRPDDPSALEQTTGLASPIEGPPSTARKAETSQPLVPSAEEKTGDYSPARDASSLTGGYTPADLPAAIDGRPVVPGYQILEELGRGGMGVVYRARQVALDRIVALKMILAGAHARPKDLERFRAEALVVARFQHPNIVQIHEVGETGGLPYFSLEFVAGDTLSKKIGREPQPPRYAAETVAALARAMQYAHDRGIVHRDLKPANVLLAGDGTPKITDFGLAKRLEMSRHRANGCWFWQEWGAPPRPRRSPPECSRGRGTIVRRCFRLHAACPWQRRQTTPLPSVAAISACRCFAS
jgi:serine/threonine protein kinase